MKMHLVIFLAFALLLAACEPRDETSEPLPLCDECLQAMPDSESLRISIPGDDSGESTTQTIGDLATFYTDTRQMSDDVNFWILGILGSLDEMLSYPPTAHEDGFCVWGPFVPSGLSPVEMRFRMRQHSDSDYDYFWEERPKNTPDDWTVVWSGAVTPSTTTARRGVGNIDADFGAMLALDPTLQQDGKMLVDYDTYTDGRRIDITFEDFMDLRPGQMAEPTNAVYHYWNRADNSGEFDFSFAADLHHDQYGDAYPALEDIVFQTQWLADGTGVSTRTVSGGDMVEAPHEGLPAPLQEVDEKECWDELFRRTYYQSVFKFSDGESAIFAEEGNADDCAF